jgi:hypothetical protein
MKIKLYGMQRAEVMKKYNPFVLDTKEYPELELEISKVVQANDQGSTKETENALEELYIKMYDTEAKGSFSDGTEYTTDLMSIVEPFKVEEDVLWDEGELTFKLLDVEK